ncbi:class I SAM-dependent DNA methyltransferase [Rhodoferax sp. 4810]|nr:class I SAM-dependent DNA methyltransferase [Rhodoferax jenense]
MTPQDFISKWGAPGGIPGPAFALNEEQGAQSHFLDLCELLGVDKPGSRDDYRFEEKSAVIGGKTGYADVFKRGVFAWEAKAPGKNLDAALKQLLTYSLALSNPPILVVSDRLTIRIHTQFTGHPSQTHTVLLDELDQPDKLALLRRIWTAPESFKPKVTNRDITEAAAKSFATLAEGLRRRGAVTDPEATANRVAHFLTQCLFCFFAEDVGLLPGQMFERLVSNRAITPAKLTQALADLFKAMADGGMFGADDIAWFNGGLFKRIDVPTLSILDVTELRNAAGLNWSAIDVSIFGTLFERGLDPAKRSQLGAHYTDTATIDRIIDPVLRRPLLQKWELVAQELQGLQAKSTKKGDKAYRDAKARFVGWLDELANFRILDPACGSGNFLFLGLKALKDIEHKSHLDAAALGLDREADLVTGPHNVLGIELNEYAAELARVTVWIGELQWRMAHGYEFKTNPVLEPLDHIECRDALLAFGVQGARLEPGSRAAQMPGPHTLRFLKSAPTSAPPTPLSDVGSLQAVEELLGSDAAVSEAAGRPEALAEMGSDPNFAKQNLGSDPISAGLTKSATSAQVTEAPWPKANIVIGNPPFLGDRKMIRELGEDYTFTLRRVYEGRVPGGADLVCYWFDKARLAIERDGLQAAGLVSTNSIRGGANRKVLDAICQNTRIYEAWSDEGWVNEGAAVRVSLVAFGNVTQEARLNDNSAGTINADLTPGFQLLTSHVDLTLAKKLATNLNTAFVGVQRNGPFDVEGSIARMWLKQPNPHCKGNEFVLRPSVTAIDVTRRPQDRWLVDFGLEKDASKLVAFESPFGYVQQRVKPTRVGLRRAWHSTYWWLFGDPRPAMRKAIGNLQRYLVTPQISKHRVFVFVPSSVLTENANIAIGRQDDVTFGILQTRFHELWSLRMGTALEDRPRYTNTTTFETFPFPAGLTPADTAHQRTETLPSGAVIPADICKENVPLAHTNKGQAATKTILTSATENAQPTASEVGVARMSGAISKSVAYEPPASEPAPPGDCQQQPSQEASPHPNPHPAEEGTSHATLVSPPPYKPTNRHANGMAAPKPDDLREQAIAIAQAAKKLNDLREAWLNPPEWTHKVPEVIPLGMDRSPYPDRIEPKPGITEQDLKALQKRTLTTSTTPARPG